MKPKLLLLLVVLINTAAAIAQPNTFPANGSVGIGTVTPEASASLDILSNTKGLLIPRMTKAQRDAIVLPAIGLLIYQKNISPGFYYYTGIGWKPVTPSSWNTNGNAGTSDGNNFIGTTDEQALVFKVNNQKAGYLSYDLVKKNTSFGYQSLLDNTSGFNNTAIGFYALYYDTSGSANTALGALTLYFNTSGSGNTASGTSALYFNTTGNSNTATGNTALYSNTTGNNNTASGAYSLNLNTSGSFNTATGTSALHFNNTGAENTASGFFSLYSNTSGIGNSASGSYSLDSNTTGNNNTASGSHSLYSNTTGNYNTASGSLALYSNSTGLNNTAFGASSLYTNTGDDNTAAGNSALFKNSKGNGNTAFGYNTLFGNIKGSHNTALGYGADVTLSNQDNSMALGYNAIVDSSNHVRIGNSSITSIGGQVGWTNFSDGRIKKNIKENVPGLAFIKLLKPVTYNFDLAKEYELKSQKDSVNWEGKYDIEKINFTGFVAQDVDAAAKKVNYDFSGVDKTGKIMGLRYSEFVVPLVKAVQELSAKNHDLQKQIDDLKAMIVSGNPQTQKNSQQVMLSSPLGVEASSLDQNSPNPFNSGTKITYTLPQKYTNAQIVITDKTGKTLKTVNVSGTGKGMLNIDAAMLSGGIYTYVLYVNGIFKQSRQMVLAK